MLTYKRVTYFEDKEAQIAYFFNESRLKFCEECPMRDGKEADLGNGITLQTEHGCPCSMLRQIASASVSTEALKAIRECDAFDEFIDEIRANDMPVGKSDHGSLIK
jgi:hypothetical protein